MGRKSGLSAEQRVEAVLSLLRREEPAHTAKGHPFFMVPTPVFAFLSPRAASDQALRPSGANTLCIDKAL